MKHHHPNVVVQQGGQQREEQQQEEQNDSHADTADNNGEASQDEDGNDSASDNDNDSESDDFVSDTDVPIVRAAIVIDNVPPPPAEQVSCNEYSVSFQQNSKLS